MGWGRFIGTAGLFGAYDKINGMIDVDDNTFK